MKRPSGRARRVDGKLLALAGVLAIFLAASVYIMLRAFAEAGMAMSLHGWIALGAGVALSLALGSGLMALSFFSARRGYDERAHHDEPDETWTDG